MQSDLKLTTNRLISGLTFKWYALLVCVGPGVAAQDATEDEEAEAGEEDVVDDATTEDEDDEAEVEDDENTELVSDCVGYYRSVCTAVVCL